ncbi:hypothetical protein [Deinococcus humi]|uniref:Putative transporter n=1 Tax=Deinococcus humi TaxID=662880 RepID=A0A7W8JQI3_9DEIO|nr:hypothetical protein [Deinococcus humi]MBB5361377.1 putative transporter [Deinococcus humi]GGO19776.1 hypothetical protein GCM10008949_04400 [Deinococcus humi]
MTALALVVFAALIGLGVYVKARWEREEEQWARGERCPICGKHVERCHGHEGIQN